MNMGLHVRGLPHSGTNTTINDSEMTKEEQIVWNRQMTKNEPSKVEIGRPRTLSDGGPPNGGLQAWLQVLGSFFLNMNSW